MSALTPIATKANSPEYFGCIQLGRHSHFKIDNEIVFPFNPAEYSRFKYGDKSIARKFGVLLAQSFVGSPLFAMVMDNWAHADMQIVVTASPYSFIPTACFAMKDYFLKELNFELIRRGLRVAEETKMTRSSSYHVDYGEMSAEQRIKLIQSESCHIDKEFMNGKFVLFMDDIFITGSHEKWVRDMIGTIRKETLCSFYYGFLYFAENINQDLNPSVENTLNYYAVKTLLDINRIIHDGEFLFNTRVIKYILSYDHQECKAFLRYQSKQFVSNMLHLAIGNSYHLVDKYKNNLEFLIEIEKSNASI